MFTGDDASSEVIVIPDQPSRPQGKERDNSVTPTPKHHNFALDEKGIHVFNVE
jgi:hypothetical protein